MSILFQFSRLFRRFASSAGTSIAFAICLSAIILAYRIQLSEGLLNSSVRPFDFNPGPSPVSFILSCMPLDLFLIAACFLITWLFSRGSHLVGNSKMSILMRTLGLTSLNLVILAVLIIHAAHIRLLFDAQTGLDISMIREVWKNIPVAELARFMNLKEALLLLIPIGLFWLIWLLPLSLRVWAFRVFVLLIVFLASFSALSVPGKTLEVPPEIRLNPALFLLSDIADHAFSRQRPDYPNRIQDSSEEPGLQPAGTRYVSPIRTIKLLPGRSTQPWNVILFIMESVGTRYAFGSSPGQPMAMPFLNRMATEGWYLNRHFTTANISNKAIFSLLSGLYDFFNRETFGIRPDAQVPSLYNFLARSHDSFLVTPSPITWYFPTAFVKNSGIREIHSYEDLNLKVKEEYHSLGHYIGRDEVQTVDFFIQRMNRAKEPFLGIYLSFAAHLPYFDYGRQYRIREEDGRGINRYYNNLNLLDHMIKRIFDNLKEKGLLDRTIFVVVGDHGQAFGQHHPDNFMHYRYSYNENLEAPAVLYQPALFKPRTFDIPTSHVDLLPTLLDALRVPYDPALFDGESLFQNRLKRKYLFFYGYEESVSCLDMDRIKVQYSLKKKKCQAFDLKTDPEEKQPLDCSSFPSQLEALQGFVFHHDSSLVSYNSSVKEKKDFHGHRHPE